MKTRQWRQTLWNLLATMKPFTHPAAVLFLLLLAGCDVAGPGDTTRAELEQAAADLEARSAQLQAEIATLREGELQNAELTARLEELEAVVAGQTMLL